MSVSVMALVWKAKLPTTEKIVLLAIADSADDDGDNAWPSVALLARKAGIGERRVQQVVRSLVEQGLLSVREQQGGVRDMRHDRRPNLYAVDLYGVKSISPREDDGVKDPTPRGERSSTHGVKPIAPYPSIDPSIDPSISDTASVVALRPEPDGFEAFWAAYPRREAKKAAQRAWAKARAEAPAERIIAGAARYRDDPNREPAFTAHASTWLNQGRWDDDPLPSRSGKASGTSSFLQAANALAEAEAFPLGIGGPGEPF